MSFFIMERDEALKKLTDPDEWAKRDPGFAASMDAIADLRAHDPKGDLYRGSDWKHVASVRGPMLDVAKCLDPHWLQDKRKVYGWLDSEQGKRYLVYDRRKDALRSDMVTFVDGKEV